MSKIASARIDDQLSQQLDDLSAAINRPRAYIIEQALQRYVHDEAWQVAKISQAVDDYEQGRADLIPFDEAMDHIDAKISAKLGQ